jgi:protein SCO1/2
VNARRFAGQRRSKPIVLAIVAASVAAAFKTASADHETALRVDRTLKGWPVDTFALVDQHGEALARERLLDCWTFVVFGDIRCTQSCTAALSALAALSRRIEGTRALQNTRFVFISLDAARATPAQLKASVAGYDERWLAATGSQQTLARLAEELGEVERGPGGSLVLIAPDASVFAEYLPPFDVPRLTADYMKARTCRGCAP